MTTTRSRVPAHSPGDANERIRREMSTSLQYFSEHKAEISARIRDLDREWDIERAIEANASVLALAGVALAAGHDRRWLALPAVVTGFLLQHAIQAGAHRFQSCGSSASGLLMRSRRSAAP